MESESVSGAVALDTVRAVRERVAGMSRPFAWLIVWGALQLSSFVGVWLLVSSGAEPPTSSWTTMSLLLPTSLLYTVLVMGAQERFGSRLRFRVGYTSAAAVVLILFLGLSALALFGPGYPWWVAILIGAIAFVLLAAAPLRFLVRSSHVREENDPWRSAPLDPIPRALTGAIGLFFGLVVALIWLPNVVAIVTVLGLVFYIFAASAPDARWSLAQVGYAWGRLHWLAFGATILLIYGVVIAIWLAGSSSASILVPSGVVVAAPLVVAAFLPRPR